MTEDKIYEKDPSKLETIPDGIYIYADEALIVASATEAFKRGEFENA